MRQQTYPSYHQTYLRVRFEKRSLSLMVRGVWPKTNDRLRSGSSNMFGFFGPRVRGVVLPPLGRKCTAQLIFIALPFWLKISSRRFRFPPALTIEKSDSGVMGPPTPRGSASLMNWYSNSEFASTSPPGHSMPNCGFVLQSGSRRNLISPLAIRSSKGGTSLRRIRYVPLH